MKMNSSEGEGSNSKAVAADENFLESGGYHHHHHRYFSMAIVRIAVLFVVVGLSCLVLYHSADPTKFFQSFHNPTMPNHAMQLNGSSPSEGAKLANLSSSLGNDENNLERILSKVAMKNKTVIISTLNAAWMEPNSIFDLFRESFRIGNQTQDLLNHVVFVALDQKAYARCLALHPHCYALSTAGIDFSGEAFFMSDDYLKMMWRRIDFLCVVLELGYNFIFSDADIMWFRNPFHRFYPDGDFQIACDHYSYDYKNLDNSPNGGFNYVKSNNKTIQFYKFWYKSKDKFPGKHDQDVLNMIKYDPFIQKIGLEIRFLDTAYFGGFCEPSKDLNLVCTMHANCCIGLDNKIHDLKMLIDDWKNYMALSDSDKVLVTHSWTVPRICG